MQLYTYKILKASSLLILVVFLFSCKEVFEEDLSDKCVTIILPQNNTKTPYRNTHFKWEVVEDATNYTLEIVRPTFSGIQYFDVDSTFSNNEIYVNLNPGNYEWRVKANNNASSTAFTKPYKLTIDTSSDLGFQNVVLTSPSSGLETNQMSHLFTWNDIIEADDYDFELKSGTSWSTGTLVFSSYNYGSNSIQVNNLDEGEYLWRVRAKNSIPSLTSYTQSPFYIDTTSPNTPVLVSPANNASISDTSTFTFSWTNPADVGVYRSGITTIIEISTDSAFSLPTTIQSSSSSKQHQINTAGTYYWRAYTEDAAGNESYYYSIDRKLIIF